MTPEQIHYVKSEITRGVSEDVLRKTLSESGYAPAHIEALVVEGKRQLQSPELQVSEPLLTSPSVPEEDSQTAVLDTATQTTKIMQLENAHRRPWKIIGWVVGILIGVAALVVAGWFLYEQYGDSLGINFDEPSELVEDPFVEE